MPNTSLRTAATIAVAGGAVYALTGALQVTNDFGGTHNTIDSTAEYMVTGALALALFLTAPMYRHLGRMADAHRAGIVATVPQIVLGLMCTFSTVNGEDASFFNAVAPICLATWLGASVVLARGLLRTGAVPKAVALALPLLLIANFPLSPFGGPMATGAFWLVVGSRLAGATPRPAAQPA